MENWSVEKHNMMGKFLYAAQMGDMVTVKRLITDIDLNTEVEDINIRYQSDFRPKPLWYAVKGCQVEIMDFILKSFTPEKEDLTECIHICIYMKQPNILYELLVRLDQSIIQQLDPLFLETYEKGFEDDVALQIIDVLDKFNIRINEEETIEYTMMYDEISFKMIHRLLEKFSNFSSNMFDYLCTEFMEKRNDVYMEKFLSLPAVSKIMSPNIASKLFSQLMQMSVNGEKCMRFTGRLLVNLGADVNLYKNTGKLAIFLGDLESLQHLVTTKRVSANSHPKLISMAAVAGDSVIVKLLLDNGWNADSKCKKGTPLKVAASHGFKDVVKILLDCDESRCSEDKTCPVCAAIKNGHTDVVHLLLDSGFKTECHCFYDLFKPLDRNLHIDEECVEKMLNAYSMKKFDCWLCLPEAIKKSNAFLTKFFIDAGGKLDDYGPVEALFMLGVDSGREQFIDVLKVLINKIGIDDLIKRYSHACKLALVMAIQRGLISVIEFFMSHFPKNFIEKIFREGYYLNDCYIEMEAGDLDYDTTWEKMQMLGDFVKLASSTIDVSRWFQILHKPMERSSFVYHSVKENSYFHTYFIQLFCGYPNLQLPESLMDSLFWHCDYSYVEMLYNCLYKDIRCYEVCLEYDKKNQKYLQENLQSRFRDEFVQKGNFYKQCLSLLSKPPSLLHMCRYTIRSAILSSCQNLNTIADRTNCLNLPRQMKNFLLFCD